MKVTEIRKAIIKKEFNKANIKLEQYHINLIYSIIAGRHFTVKDDGIYELRWLDWCEGKIDEYKLCVKLAFEFKEQEIDKSFKDNSFHLNGTYSLDATEQYQLTIDAVNFSRGLKYGARNAQQVFTSSYNGLAAEYIFNRETNLNNKKVFQYSKDGYIDIDAYNRLGQSLNIKCIKDNEDMFYIDFTYTRQSSFSDAYILFQTDYSSSPSQYTYLGYYTHNDIIQNGKYGKLDYSVSKKGIFTEIDYSKIDYSEKERTKSTERHVIQIPLEKLRTNDSWKHFIL